MGSDSFGVRRMSSPIARARMRFRKTRALAMQFFAQRDRSEYSVIAHAAALQFRHDEIDEIAKRFVRQCIGEVETDRRRSLRPTTATRRQSPAGSPTDNGPSPPIPPHFAISRTVHTRVGSALDESLHRGLHRVALDVTQRLVQFVLRQVDACPAATSTRALPRRLHMRR